MRRIYLIRHGTPLFEEGVKRCIGHTDIPLSEKGISQILNVKKELDYENITKIYSSPLKRCVATAEILSDNQIPVLIEDDFIEIDMGLWENRTFEEIKREFSEDYDRRIKELDTFCAHKGESFLQCQKRVAAAFHKITGEALGDLAIVSHAGVIKSLLCAVAETNLKNVLTFKVSYGEVIILEQFDDCIVNNLTSWRVVNEKR
jgi:alpha-ribazole phosphatase